MNDTVDTIDPVDPVDPKDIEIDLGNIIGASLKVDEYVNDISRLSVKTVKDLYKSLRNTELFRQSLALINNMPIPNVPGEWSITFNKYCTPARSQRKVIKIDVPEHEHEWSSHEKQISLTVGKKYGVVLPYNHVSTEIIPCNTYNLIHDEQIKLITNSKKREAGDFLANIRSSLENAYRQFEDPYVIHPTSELTSRFMALRYYARLKDGTKVPVLEHANKTLANMDRSQIKCYITPLNGHSIWFGPSRLSIRRPNSTPHKFNGDCALRFSLVYNKKIISEIVLNAKGMQSLYDVGDYKFPAKGLAVPYDDFQHFSMESDHLYEWETLLSSVNVIAYFWLDIFNNPGIQKDVIKFLDTYRVAGKALKIAQQQYASLLFLTDDW